MEESQKKTYEKPAIVHSDPVEARAVRCAKVTAIDCPNSPITS